MRSLELTGAVLVSAGIVAAVAGSGWAAPLFGIGLAVFLIGRFSE